MNGYRYRAGNAASIVVQLEANMLPAANNRVKMPSRTPDTLEVTDIVHKVSAKIESVGIGVQL